MKKDHINKILMVCLVVIVALFFIEKQKNIGLLVNTRKNSNINTKLIADESLKSLSGTKIRKNNQIISTKNKELFDFVLDKVRYEYVEEVEDKKLYESALNGLLSSLDPHSSYLNEKEYKEMLVSTKGEFGGLGIVVTKDSNFIKVISPIDDTPAAKIGIKSGDYISKIDGELTYDMSLEKAVEKMRGKPGTKVDLVILRKGESEPLEFSIKREIIKVEAVKGRIENKNIIYIKISNFIESTYEDVVETFNKLKKTIGEDKLGGFILDLRNDPGGLLDQAVKIGSLFLENDKTVVSIKGRDDELLETYKSEAKKVLIDNIPVIVLVNEGSASASEIVAGALQDHKKAIIMGTKTFGKASVQTVYPLPNGGAMKMTIARYYTPLGRSIQADGIEPDINVPEAVVDFSENKYEIRREKDLVGHLEKGKEDVVAKAIKENQEKKDLVKNVSDYQLSKAIDLLIGINYYNKNFSNNDKK